uniref:Uncharacterized protein n=2 Tax=Oryza TaxID=4527 RepID=A0A0E0HBZ0_ORYNI
MADGRARFGRLWWRRWWLKSEGERKGEVGEWICLIEAKLVAQGFGLGCFRDGDRSMADDGRHGRRERAWLMCVEGEEELAGYL